MADGNPELDGPAGLASAKILKSERYEAISEARRFIDRAREDADRILADARSDAESLREAAVEQGRAEAAEMVANYSRLMRAEMDAVQPRLLGAVTTCLRRLLSPYPAHEVIAGTVARTMKEIELGKGAHLIVAPQFVRVLREHFGERGISPEVLDVQGDPDCPQQSSILRCHFGDIELGIETQLRAIERGLRMAEDQAAETES